jgi:hypothetical protein
VTKPSELEEAAYSAIVKSIEALFNNDEPNDDQEISCKRLFKKTR